MPPTAPPPVADARTARRSRPSVPLLALVAALALLLTGCGVRLETPPPAALVPDELEVVRQRTTADALVIVSLAGAAALEPAATQDGTAEDLAEVLEQVADASQQHLDALGGVYDPGTDDLGSSTEASDGPTPSPARTPAQASAEQVALALEDAAAVARADASTVPDGPLARLLASVTASRVLLAERVRSTAGLPRAPGVAVEPPAALPSGPPGSAVSALIQSEDAAGTAWEVYTARTSAEYRTGPTQRAEQHREAAEAWARLAQAAGAGEDPRRSAYDLPEALLDPATPRDEARAALAAIEADLGATYATLVALTASGERAPFLDGLIGTTRSWARTTGTVPTFPGLPEQQA